MKAYAVIDPEMLAPCGINCAVCYRYLGKKPCAGCRADTDTAQQHIRRCKIKNCAGESGLSHCFLCAKFPCGLIKNLDKRYKTRYGVSLAENGLAAKEMGIAHALAKQLEAYTCTACGGVISMHDGICSQCKTEYSLGKRSVKDDLGK